MSGWIGVDLDGTLAEYHGWNDGTIGPPVPAMLERVKRWLAEGRDVRIMTARVSGEQNVARRPYREIVQNWCREHLGQALPVTCCKDYAMIALYDDRAVSVEANTGRITTEGWEE